MATGFAPAPWSQDNTISVLNTTVNAKWDIAVQVWRYMTAGVASRVEFGQDGYIRSFTATTGAANAVITWSAPLPSSGDFVKKTGDTMSGGLTITSGGITSTGVTSLTGNTFVAGTLQVNGSAAFVIQTGAVEHSLSNGGGVAEWSMRQPAPATNNDLLFSKRVSGVYTDYMRITTTGVIGFAGSTHTYGSLSLRGTKGGYSGIAFEDNAGVLQGTFMVNSTTSGVYASGDASWQWYNLNGNFVTAGTYQASANAMMGSHPAYGANFSAFWNEAARTGVSTSTYGIMQQNTGATYISSGGTTGVYLRLNNNDSVIVRKDGSGFTETAFFDGSTTYGRLRGGAPNFHLDSYGGQVYLNWYGGTGGVTVGNGAGATGTITANNFSGTFGSFNRVTATGGQGVNYIADDIVSYRGANSATGVIYLDNAKNHYLYFDGTNYSMVNGNLYVNGALVTTSSREIKRGIRELPKLAKKDVRTLSPKLFNFRHESEGTPPHIGFIAEEIRDALGEQALHQSVAGANGETISMGYDPTTLIAVLWQRVETLEDELQALKER